MAYIFICILFIDVSTKSSQIVLSPSSENTLNRNDDIRDDCAYLSHMSVAHSMVSFFLLYSHLFINKSSYQKSLRVNNITNIT